MKHLSREASPTLFAVIMGTGAVSILFYTFPYGRQSLPMMIFSLIFFFLNLTLFLIFTVLLIIRYRSFRGSWTAMLYDPVSSLNWGCFPMGITTLINVGVDVIYKHFHVGGRGFLYFLWGVWWLDIAISILCCWGGVHWMGTRQKHALDRMSPSWLLPIVTLIVASSSGAILARALEEISSLQALVTVGFAIFLVTAGLSLSLMILTVYFLRLIVYGLPTGPSILSAFLPLGPMAQSGFGILVIGQNLRTILPYKSNSAFLMSNTTGDIVDVICTCISFLLWMMSTTWIIFAFLGFIEVFRKEPVPFRLSFWGLVFPNGVYANLTIQLSNALDSRFFRVLGAIYAVATLLLWISIAVRSLFSLRLYVMPEKEKYGHDDIEVNSAEKTSNLCEGHAKGTTTSTRTSTTQLA